MADRCSFNAPPVATPEMVQAALELVWEDSESHDELVRNIWQAMAAVAPSAEPSPRAQERCRDCDGYNCDDGCAYPDNPRAQALEILPCWMCGADEASTYLGEPGPGAVKCFAVGCDAEISGFSSDKEAISEWNRRSLAMDAAMTEAYCTSDENDLTECFQHHIRTSIGWQAFGSRPGKEMQMYEEGFKAGYRRCKSDNEPELGEEEELSQRARAQALEETAVVRELQKARSEYMLSDLEIAKRIIRALSSQEPVRAQALEEAAQALEAWGDIYGDNAAKCVRALSSQPVADGWLPIEKEPDNEQGPFLVTNNPSALNAFGRPSHVWCVSGIYKEKDGSFCAFEGNQKIHGLLMFMSVTAPLPSSPGASE